MNEKKTSNASTSRRQFLQASTAAAVGAGLMFNDRIARSAHGAAASDATLRVGLVGCGGRGRGAAVHALTADPNAKLVALADAFADYVEQSVETLKKTEVADRVSVDLDHRFSGFDAFQKLIQSDVAVQTTYNVGPPWFRNKDRQPDWTEMEYQMRNWYPFTWLSGDHNVEQHVHSLDRSAWSLRDQPPQKAWGSGGRQFRSEPAIGNIFDHHCVTYEYENGVRVYSHCRRQAGCTNDISDHLLGTKGRCNLMKYRIEGETNWRYEGPKPNGFIAEHEALFTSIRAGRPVNNGLYMAHSTMWAILGRMATYTGKTITWEQAMNSKEDLSPERYAWDAQPPILPDENGNYPLALPGVTKFV